MARKTRRKRAAVAHRIAQIAQYDSDLWGARGIDQEAQGAIEVLPGAEHDRKLAGQIGHIAA
jgi:hypothetical protein